MQKQLMLILPPPLSQNIVFVPPMGPPPNASQVTPTSLKGVKQTLHQPQRILRTTPQQLWNMITTVQN